MELDGRKLNFTVKPAWNLEKSRENFNSVDAHHRIRWMDNMSDYLAEEEQEKEELLFESP